jgi:hypothetical protein
MPRRQPLFVSLLLFIAAVTVWAQPDSSGLNGTVSDAAKRPLPGAQITAVQQGTGLRREAVSSSDGTYHFSQLPVGVYEVAFSHEGFQPVRIENVIQRLGQTRTLDATLPLPGAKEQVDVIASPQLLDRTSDALNTDVEHEQVELLPLNGQNWAMLTALGAAAVDTSGSTGGGNQRSVRFAGRGRDDNNFSYDGIDATNIINQAQQPYVRLAIPLDTIEEFQINPMLATAENGGTGGGQLAVSSPSGSNRLRGDVYGFLRNNVFDAREPIDLLNPHQPPLHLSEFGGAFGGPIVRNKTFFYLSYSGYRQSYGQTLTGYVPSDSFRQQVLAASPELAPVINAYPEGVSPYPANSDVAEFIGEGKQITQEDSGMFRLDHRLSERLSIFARANIDYALNDVPYSASATQYLLGVQENTSRPVNAVIALTQVISPKLLNEVKIGFNRSTADSALVNGTGLPYEIDVSDSSGANFTALNRGRVTVGTGNAFIGMDDLSWVLGRHLLKTGVEVRYLQMNQGNSTYGKIAFKSFAHMVENVADKASLNGALPVNGLRKTQFFTYLQDEFKLRSNLTLNLGARYSFFNVFTESQGRGIPFDFDTCGVQGYCAKGASFGQLNTLSLDPRFAVAWAPKFLRGKTVIRAGGGIYHEDGQLDDQNIPDKNEVYNYTLKKVSFPIQVDSTGKPINLGSGTVAQSANAEQRKRPDTYVSQWGLSVQQELPAQFLGTASYVGSKGTHLLYLSYVNMGATVGDINPALSTVIPWRGNVGNSEYHAMSLSLKRSFSKGILFSMNYTWSHEIDDGSNGSGDGDSLTPQNVACQPCERASGAFDVRHVFNANFIYDLPFGLGRHSLNGDSVARKVLGSWSVSSIVVARSGFPINVVNGNGIGPDGNTNNQRPNLVPGVSPYLSGGALNPAAFVAEPAGTFGDVPRDFLRANGTWQVDMGLIKQLQLSEALHMKFRADFFNLFNHPQYAAPQSDISSSAFGLVQAPLNPTPIGMGTPRQIQLALRFSF